MNSHDGAETIPPRGEGLGAGKPRRIEAWADVPVSFDQKDDASNFQNETNEEIAREIEGLAGRVGHVLNDSFIRPASRSEVKSKAGSAGRSSRLGRRRAISAVAARAGSHRP